jgi:hypothetical protein
MAGYKEWLNILGEDDSPAPPGSALLQPRRRVAGSGTGRRSGSVTIAQ